MGVFGWLERKVFLGDVIKDYGVLDEKSVGIGRLRTSVVLCRRKGQLKLAFRTTGTSPLSASVNYAMIDATPAALAKLAEVLQDAQAEIFAMLPHAWPNAAMDRAGETVPVVRERGRRRAGH